MYDITSDKMLSNALSKGNTTRNSKITSNGVDGNYIKMLENTMYYLMYSEKLMELCLSAFKWSNVPDSMNIRNLEETLHRQGKAVIAKHKETKEICNFRLGASRGKLDIYGEPKLYQVHGHEYYDDVDVSNSAIIYNNRSRRSSYRIINNIALKLAEADLIISQNLGAQSMPIIITGPAAKKKDITNTLSALSNFAPAIIGDSTLTEDIEMKVHNVETPFIVDKINTHKHTVWNEGMTFLGVDNSNQEKKERMITGEVNANDGQINLFRESMLTQRQEAVENINQIFGTNIIVEYNDGPMDEIAELLAIAGLENEMSEVELNKSEALLNESQAVQSIEE